MHLQVSKFTCDSIKLRAGKGIIFICVFLHMH